MNPPGWGTRKLFGGNGTGGGDGGGNLDGFVCEIVVSGAGGYIISVLSLKWKQP